MAGKFMTAFKKKVGSKAGAAAAKFAPKKPNEDERKPLKKPKFGKYS